MKLTIFSVYDSKAKAYIPPFYAGNIELGQRAFTDCVINPEHNFAKHPADYSLMVIGTWDDETGKIENEKTPKSLGLAMEYQRTQTDTTQIDLELVENK